MDNLKQIKTNMKKTIMIFAIAAIVSACGGAATTETADSTAVAVDTVATVAIDTVATEGGSSSTGIKK